MARRTRAGYVRDMDTYDMVVVGAGLAGLATALAAQAQGLDVRVLDERADKPSPTDARATFLARSSLRMLARMGVEVQAQPVRHILAVEGRAGRPVRGTGLHFAPNGESEVDDGMIGAMVENADLHAALRRAAGDMALQQARVGGVRERVEAIELATSAGSVHARLVAACDGRDSTLRRLVGIPVERHDYRRSALTFTIAHSRPHEGVAHQIFMPAGPLAVLPLTGARSSVVWTDRPEALRAAHALSDAALADELAYRLGDGLGEIALAGPRALYPLERRLAARLMEGRVALVGDSAHSLHPLAGQGFNLSLRDAAALAEIAGEAVSLGRDPGGPALAGYSRWRRGDVATLALATHAIDAAFRAPLGPLRRFATELIDASPLKRHLMAEAAGERPNLPEIMA